MNNNEYGAWIMNVIMIMNAIIIDVTSNVIEMITVRVKGSKGIRKA